MRRSKWNTPKTHAAPAPAPIVHKTPKLNTAGLIEAYEWMPVSRDAAFKLAFEWYGQNEPALLYGKPLDTDQARSRDRARKAQELGTSEFRIGNKDAGIHAWTTAIHLLESKVWASKPLPKLDEALNTTTVTKRVANIQTVLENLSAAYAPTRFRMTFGADREFTGEEILIPRAELEQMTLQPPIKAVLGEAVTVAKITSLVTDQDGNTVLDSAKFSTQLPLILAQVGEWAAKADGSLSKPLAKSIHSSTTPRAKQTSGGPATARQKPVPKSAIDPFGVFRANTVMANLAAVLGDGQFHTFSELRAVATACGVAGNGSKLGTDSKPGGQVKDLLTMLPTRGVKIERQGDKVRAYR